MTRFRSKRHSTHRRRHAGFIFLYIPWWVNFVLAALCYLGIVYGLPALSAESPLIAPIANGLRPLAPYLALFFFILAGVCIINDLRQLRRVSATAAANALRTLDWQQILGMVADGFRRQGFRVEYADPKTGIDLLLTTATGERWVASCRHCFTGVVDVPAVREFFGIVTAESATAGVLLTAGGFTQSAVDFAYGKGLFLISGNEFLALLDLTCAHAAS